MKKNLLLLVLIFIFGTFQNNILQAQTFGESLRFGLSLQPTVNWLSATSDSVDVQGGRFTASYGLVAERLLNDRYALSGGIFITPQGGKYQYVGADSTIRLQLRYLEFPVSIKLRTNEIGYFTYFAQIGFVPAFRLRSRYSSEGGNMPVTSESANSFTNFIDIALIAGLGVEYALAENTTAFGGLYYQSGFINVVDDNDGESIRTGNIGLRIGIFF